MQGVPFFCNIKFAVNRSMEVTANHNPQISVSLFIVCRKERGQINLVKHDA